MPYGFVGPRHIALTLAALKEFDREGWRKSSHKNRQTTAKWEDNVQALTRRSLMLGAMAAPVSAYAQACYAQTWPTIRLVVPYPPAGSTDVIARLVQPELQRRLSTSVIVENRPGASGSIGTASVAK